jgi:Peptidase family M28
MKRLKRIFIGILIVFIGIFVWAKIYSIEPALVTRTILADTVRIKNDLTYLTKECQFRNFMHLDQLNKSADYIKNQFAQITDAVEFQNYKENDLEFKNVICSIGPKDAERIIVGAHYDACLDQEGADDNASGVCGLLELARLLKNENLKYRIDFVAYSTEEPPFFGKKTMGSYIHAKSLFDNKIKVKGMICLEMIGVYFDEPNTQDYPVFFLEWFYGNKGNFITVAQRFSNGDFGNFVRSRMKRNQVIPTKSFTAPQWVAGIDLSDQRNYWEFNYSAVMITNTSFYRNKKYHTVNDTAERLNIKKMSMVIDELYRAIIDVQ